MVILRVVCDPEVNLERLPGGGELVSCSKDVSHSALLTEKEDVREA